MSGPAGLPARPPRVATLDGPAARGPGTGAADLRPRFADLLRQRWDDPAQAPGLGAPADEALPWPEPSPPLLRREDDAAQAGTDAPAPPTDAPAPQAGPPRDHPVDLQPAGPTGAAQAHGAGLSRHDPPRPVRDLAHAVARFCNDRAVSDGEGWQVQIELRPDILPATTLQLSVSPHWLCLRFDIRDDTALHLVSMHQQALADRLEESLVRRRDISISFG